MPSSLSSQEIIQTIQRLVLPGAPEPTDPEILEHLRSLTQDLIQAYQHMGRLQADPFSEAQARPVQLFEAEVRARLRGKAVLVTGGEGCVGSRLITRLLELGISSISSIDQARCAADSSTPVSTPSPTPALTPALTPTPTGVKLYAADIRDREALRAVFATEQPEVVFHIAAQRLPGLAETKIRETVTSNVFGTQNVLRACEEFQVQQCVFSSTGKASRYLTAEVYAASKKIAEGLFAAAARRGSVRCSMVRFTHMLENSAMGQEIEQKVALGQPVNIHAPDRYVAGQNVGEAVNLLLNALVLAEPGRLKFNLVRHLGWPTESLEVALYKILRSGRNLPIYFQGVLPGYEEPFFWGQIDGDNPIDLNPLVNALETAYNLSISATQDMIVSQLVDFDPAVLHQHLEILRTRCKDLTQPEQPIKQELARAVRAVTRSGFQQASPQKLLKILRWGVNPKQFHSGHLDLESFQEIIELLVQSLVDRLTIADIHSSISLPEFVQLMAVLSTLPSIQSEVARLQAIADTTTPAIELAI
jgi:dTDP-4-dehydrorhamnose reductase